MITNKPELSGYSLDYIITDKCTHSCFFCFQVILSDDEVSYSISSTISWSTCPTGATISPSAYSVWHCKISHLFLCRCCALCGRYNRGSY